MGFPGTWMTESESMVYRVVPKCACSTIGQIMFYSDHGTFFDGDIHDAQSGLHKWALDHSKDPITQRIQAHDTYAFTCVRNPYTRILSSFFDKICGIQRNGKRYRGNLVPLLIQKYGIEVGGDDGKQDFDQIKSFRRFLLFARDTIRWRRPMDPDIFWLDWQLSLFTFILGPVLAFIAHNIGGRIRTINRELQTRFGDMTHVLEETIKGHKVVKIYGGQEYESARFRTIAKRVRHLQFKHKIAAHISVPIVELFGSFIIAAVMYIRQEMRV